MATDVESLGDVVASIPLDGQRILFFDSFDNILDAHVVRRIEDRLNDGGARSYCAVIRRGRDLHFNVMERNIPKILRKE